MKNYIMILTKLLYLFSLFLTNLVFSLPYSSEFLDDDFNKNINIYYSKNLNHLTKALKPRPIHYISSENYSQYHKIHVTGILFTHEDKEAKGVTFMSSLDNFKRHSMTRNEKGIWYYLLSPKPYTLTKPQKKIRYRFLVDGAFENDMNGDIETHSDGSKVSVYYFGKFDFTQKYGIIIVKRETSEQRQVMFRVKIPEADKVSLIGNFNQWNQKLDVMKKVDKNIFEIRKELSRGKYIYLYQVSGEYHVDRVNTQKRSHPVYGRVSYFEVK